MDCIKAQKLIRPYLEGQLSDTELEDFLDHVGKCPDCHDELEIYYSIYQTLGEDTDDGDYNFSRKLDEKLLESRKYLSKRRTGRYLMAVILIAAEFFFLAALSGIVTRQLESAQHQAAVSEQTEAETETETEETPRTDASETQTGAEETHRTDVSETEAKAEETHHAHGSLTENRSRPGIAGR